MGINVEAVSMILIILFIIIFIMPAILAWLWNWTMPEVFRLKEITYWQSFRLIIISAILFSPGIFNFSG